ncbi:hypothetical protein GCM10022209_23400 [Chitinophaga oryziterrae]
MDTLKYFNRYKRTWHNVASWDDYQGTPIGPLSSNGHYYAVSLSSGSFQLIDADSLAVGQYYFCIPAPVMRTRFVDSTHFIVWNDRNIKGGTPEWLTNWGGGYSFRDQLVKWNAMTGNRQVLGTKNGISNGKITASFDGRYVLTGITENKKTIYDNRTGQQVSSFSTDPEYDYYNIIFSENGSTLFYLNISKERRLHLYRVQTRNVRTGKMTHSIPFEDCPNILGITEDGHYGLLSFGSDGNGTQEHKLIDLSTGKVLFSKEGLIFQATGSSMVAEDEEKSVFCHNTFYAVDQQQLQQFTIKNNEVKRGYRLPTYATTDNFYADKGWLTDKSGKYLLTQRDQHLYLWNGADGQLLDTMLFPGRLDQYRFSADGSFIFLLGNNMDSIVVCKWDLYQKTKLVKELENPLAYLGNNMVFNSLSISPSRRLAVCGSTDHFSLVYDLEAGKILYQLVMVGLSNYVFFDPNGQFECSRNIHDLIYYNQDDKIIKQENINTSYWVPDLVKKITHQK